MLRYKGPLNYLLWVELIVGRLSMPFACPASTYSTSLQPVQPPPSQRYLLDELSIHLPPANCRSGRLGISCIGQPYAMFLRKRRIGNKYSVSSWHTSRQALYHFSLYWIIMIRWHCFSFICNFWSVFTDKFNECPYYSWNLATRQALNLTLANNMTSSRLRYIFQVSALLFAN